MSEIKEKKTTSKTSQKKSSTKKVVTKKVAQSPAKAKVENPPKQTTQAKKVSKPVAKKTQPVAKEKITATKTTKKPAVKKPESKKPTTKKPENQPKANMVVAEKPVVTAPVEKKKKKLSRNIFLLLLSLILIFTGCFCAQVVNTNAFKTDVFDFTIPTEDGQWVEGTVFKPKTATASNPAPCVVFVPGFQRTKESHYDVALEIARRGMVCFIIDPYNQGNSSASLNTSSSTAEAGAYGAIPVVNYLYDTNNVNYIDRNNISIVGHSAGGNSALTAATYFSNLAGGVFENCKVKSVYVSGYIRNIISVDVETDENGNTVFDEETGLVVLGDDGVDWEGSKVSSLICNLGFGYSIIDEGAWQNINLTGDISRVDSYESLALITAGGVNLELRETGLTPGKVYGQAAEGTMRVGYQETCYHGVQPFDTTATSHIMYFLDMVNENDSGIAIGDQVWMWKQFFQLVIMVGLFMLIFPVCGLLLQTPFFRTIKFEREVYPRTKSVSKWIVFIAAMLIGAVCACFTFVPLADLSKEIFIDATAHKVTTFFPERMNNAIMLWAMVNGLIGFALFFGARGVNKLITKLQGREQSTVGTKMIKSNFNIGFVNFLKTLLCAFLVWCVFYSMVHIADYAFNIDARFTFVAIRETNIRYLLYALMYLPFFFIFYLSNSVRVNLANQTNNSNKNKFLSYFLAVLGNTLGLFALFAIQYLSIAFTGVMHWTTDWLYTNMLWILIPMMFLLPIFQKFFYKRSGNIYLGALITCLIFVTMMMCNSVAHGPFYF